MNSALGVLTLELLRDSQTDVFQAVPKLGREHRAGNEGLDIVGVKVAFEVMGLD